MRVHTKAAAAAAARTTTCGQARMHPPLKTNMSALHTYVGAKCLWTLPSALAMT